MKPAANPELESHLAPIFLRSLRARGGDPTALARKHHLPEDAEARSTLVLSLARFEALSIEAAAQIGDPWFGLHVAAALPRGTYGLVEFASRTAPTMREAFAQVARFQRLLDAGTTYRLEVDRGEAVLEQRLPGSPRCLGRHGNEFTMALLQKLAGELVGGVFGTTRVWFAHEAPDDLGELAAWFAPAALGFAAAGNGFAFPARELARPVTSADAALHDVLATSAHQRLPAERPGEDFVARVRLRTREALPAGGSVAERVAEGFGMSVRTLQRRLRDDDLAFQDLLDQERHALAGRYLADPALSLAEIAYRLGYSDMSAFNRACKRWTGEAPSRVRRG